MSLSSSFKCRKLSKTTFLVVEDDLYQEHPFIYVKIHQKVPTVVISDTGCDEPRRARSSGRFIHLREYLESCPLDCNGNAPLNPGGLRQYIIICSHCQYDHTGGIMQFLRGGSTDIVASAAGRDFIESDLGKHGLFDYANAPSPYGLPYYKKPTPYCKVTHWAQAFERLHWPLSNTEFPHRKQGCTDLGITIIQTVGHTPDELAWYDHDEMHLYVGDSFYEEGEDGMAIIFPPQGNLIEWVFSMQKLAVFVKSENAKAAKGASAENEDGWVDVAKRVQVGCGHQTASADGEEILSELEKFSFRVFNRKVPVVHSQTLLGEVNDTWRDKGKHVKMSLRAPRRLMEEARTFFSIWGQH